MVDKRHVLAEIRRVAAESGGKPPGRRAFQSRTGIRESDWLGRYWTKWGDALAEAGFSPNLLQAAHPQEMLLERLASLARELGRFPTRPEIRMKRRGDQTFPSDGSFERFGAKSELARALLEFSQQRGYEDVVALCTPVVGVAIRSSDAPSPMPTGSVYLIKSGRHYKIGRTTAMGRREYELNLQLPKKPSLVHEIRTDDPVGIERYWHDRFKGRRKGGEWFELSQEDVAAFKARRFM